MLASALYIYLKDCTVARSSSYRLRFIWVDGVYVLAPPLHVPRVPSPRMACPSAHAYALRLYRSARDLQLVDSCLLTDEVCGELSHRAREIFADRTAGSAAPNEFGGVGTAEGQPVCTTQFSARARTPMWQSVSLSQLSPPRGSFVSLSSCKLRSSTAKEIGSPSAVVPVPSLLPVSHPCRRASRAQPAHPACAHMRTRARARMHTRTHHTQSMWIGSERTASMASFSDRDRCRSKLECSE